MDSKTGERWESSLVEGDPVVRYYQGTPSREDISAEDQARLGYAGGDLTAEKAVREFYEFGRSPFRWLGTAPQTETAHGFTSGIRDLRSLPLPPADY